MCISFGAGPRQYGVLRCQKVWDRIAGMYIPKIIEVTELFFAMTGMEQGKYEAAQRQQLGWINQGLLEKGDNPITLTEARRRAREQHIHRAFEHRKNTHHIKTQQKKARLLMEKEETEARSEILAGLVARYSKEELQTMGHAELKKQVSKIYYQMRKLAAIPPPDTPAH